MGKRRPIFSAIRALLLSVGVVLALPSAIYAAGVEAGMSETALLELKGNPESTASVGVKTIYRFPDMQVTVIGGKVVSFKDRDALKEKRNADERTQRVKKLQDETPDGPNVSALVEITQVLGDGGCLVELMKQERIPGTSTELARIGGGGYREPDKIDTYGSGVIAYIAGIPRGWTDGERLEVTMAPKGQYVYTNVQGARSTVRKYLLINFSK